MLTIRRMLLHLLPSALQVYSADEAFVTGTFAGLIPVKLVDGRLIGSGQRGPVTAALQQAYMALQVYMGPASWLSRTFVFVCLSPGAAVQQQLWCCMALVHHTHGSVNMRSTPAREPHPALPAASARRMKRLQRAGLALLRDGGRAKLRSRKSSDERACVRHPACCRQQWCSAGAAPLAPRCCLCCAVVCCMCCGWE